MQRAICQDSIILELHTDGYLGNGAFVTIPRSNDQDHIILGHFFFLYVRLFPTTPGDAFALGCVVIGQAEDLISYGDSHFYMVQLDSEVIFSDVHQHPHWSFYGQQGSIIRLFLFPHQSLSPPEAVVDEHPFELNRSFGYRGDPCLQLELFHDQGDVVGLVWFFGTSPYFGLALIEGVALDKCELLAGIEVHGQPCNYQFLEMDSLLRLVCMNCKVSLFELPLEFSSLVNLLLQLQHLLVIYHFQLLDLIFKNFKVILFNTKIPSQTVPQEMLPKQFQSWHSRNTQAQRDIVDSDLDTSRFASSRELPFQDDLSDFGNRPEAQRFDFLYRHKDRVGFNIPILMMKEEHFQVG